MESSVNIINDDLNEKDQKRIYKINTVLFIARYFMSNPDSFSDRLTEYNFSKETLAHALSGTRYEPEEPGEGG